MIGDELSEDETWTTLRRHRGRQLVTDASLRFRYTDAFSFGRALAPQLVIGKVPLAIALIGVSAAIPGGSGGVRLAGGVAELVGLGEGPGGRGAHLHGIGCRSAVGAPGRTAVTGLAGARVRRTAPPVDQGYLAAGPLRVAQWVLLFVVRTADRPVASGQPGQRRALLGCGLRGPTGGSPELASRAPCIRVRVPASH